MLSMLSSLINLVCERTFSSIIRMLLPKLNHTFSIGVQNKHGISLELTMRTWWSTLSMDACIWQMELYDAGSHEFDDVLMCGQSHFTSIFYCIRVGFAIVAAICAARRAPHPWTWFFSFAAQLHWNIDHYCNMNRHECSFKSVHKAPHHSRYVFNPIPSRPIYVSKFIVEKLHVYCIMSIPLRHTWIRNAEHLVAHHQPQPYMYIYNQNMSKIRKSKRCPIQTGG